MIIFQHENGNKRKLRVTIDMQLQLVLTEISIFHSYQNQNKCHLLMCIFFMQCKNQTLSMQTDVKKMCEV